MECFNIRIGQTDVTSAEVTGNKTGELALVSLYLIWLIKCRSVLFGFE